MLSAAIQITATIALAGIVGWICYLVWHMHGGAEARARWAREEGRG